MQFRAHTPSDDRRRRLLNEEVATDGGSIRRRTAAVRTDGGSVAGDSSAGPSGGATSRAAQGARYTQAALMENQPRITDFIPRSAIALMVLLLLNLAVIAGLEWLYYMMPHWAAQTTDGRVAAFDLDSEGSLGAWYSSTILAVAAAFAFLVYSLRRHRIDDYRGKYRTWCMAALCFALMSVDESASLHEGSKEMITIVTGQRQYGDGSAWWVAGYGVVLGWIGLRLLLDMRGCWSARIAFVLAGASFAVAVLAQLELVLPQRGAVGVMLEEGLEMLGNVLLWFTCLIYARFLVRDIEGLIPQRQRKQKSTAESGDRPAPRRRRAASEESSSKRTRKTAVASTSTSGSSAADSDSSSRKPTTSTSKPATTVPSAKERTTASTASAGSAATSLRSASGDAHRVDSAESTPAPKLSKAERRALRKERRSNR